MLRQTWMFAPPGEGEENRAEAVIRELLQALPGVLRLEQADVSSGSTGQIKAASLLDVYFADEDAMNAAYASPDGKRISREMLSNAAAVLDVLTFEDVRNLLPHESTGR